MLDWFDDGWRPDLSNVYIEVKQEPPERYRHVLPDAPFAFKFTLLGDLTAERMDLLNLAAAGLIEYDFPVIVSIAWVNLRWSSSNTRTSSLKTWGVTSTCTSI